MKVAVDIGYGFTKAVAGDRQVIFPSLVAPAANSLAEALGRTFQHKVKIKNTHLNTEKLVGEAAAQSQSACRLSAQEKAVETHDILLLTAAYLCCKDGAGCIKSLGVGLPLAYYQRQKEALKRRLQGLTAWVSVDNGPDRHIRFEQVEVFPQGIGAITSAENLPEGLIGLIDVGTFTTDYFLLEIKEGLPYLLPEGCGSLEGGTQLVLNALAEDFQKQAGAPLPARLQQQALARAQAGKPIHYWERDIDLSSALQKAVQEVAESISSHVQAAFGDRLPFLEKTYLAGGGSLLLFEHLKQRYPEIEIIPDPIFANARGYLRLLE